MDEPFGALNPVNRDRLQDEYKKIQVDLDLTTAKLTHDMTEALIMADPIAVMGGGRPIRSGAPHDLLTDPADPPYGRVDGEPQASGPSVGTSAVKLIGGPVLVERILQQLRRPPDNLSNHPIITMIPSALSLAISLPLAIMLMRRKSLRYPVLTVVSVLQTIPSLALLTVMVLAGVAYLAHRFVGLEFSSLGLYTTVIALTLYGITPMLRNTIIGILGVDPAMTEAAR